DHLLFSVKSRRSKRAQVELFPAWAVKPLFLAPRLRHARGSSGSRPSDDQGAAPSKNPVIPKAPVASRFPPAEEARQTALAGVVSLMLIDQFAMSRTKARVHPPAAIPKISGTDTYSQLSVTPGASIHSRFSCTRVARFCSIHCPLVPCLRRNKAQGLIFFWTTTCIFWKPGRSLLRDLCFGIAAERLGSLSRFEQR